MKRLLLVGFLILLPTRSHAVFDTGNDLYNFCTSKNDLKLMLCLGLVTGYYEGLSFTYDCDTSPKVTREQMKDIVVKFLRDNPAERHRAAVALAGRAYFLAFSCKKRPD